jgi:hypothetical protein
VWEHVEVASRVERVVKILQLGIAECFGIDLGM